MEEINYHKQGKAPNPILLAKEPLVSQMVVCVGDRYIKNNPSPKLVHIGLFYPFHKFV